MNFTSRIITCCTALFCSFVFAAENTGDSEEKNGWDVNAPPGDSRQIPIRTSSGTWMSLDVSPDGRTIAFDLLGDIYLVPIEGGDARSIDSGHSWSMQLATRVIRPTAEALASISS